MRLHARAEAKTYNKDVKRMQRAQTCLATSSRSMTTLDNATLGCSSSVHSFAFRACTRDPTLRRKRAFVRASQAQLQATEEAVRLKDSLRAALKNVKSCGIFGLQAAELTEIKKLTDKLEAQNPLTDPTSNLKLLAGPWTVIFSTIKVTGSKRVRLGLRDLVQIGTLTQEIDDSNQIAVNRVGFNVPMFGVKDGELLLKASYKVSSPSRVEIELEEATLAPERLQSVFEANFDLLLSIFNPEGHLDITYCDDQLRCGRDDKGNLFILERGQP